MWDKIWNMIRTIMLCFFGPPDVDDEAALLKWIDESLAWLGWFAQRTKTKLDDQIVAALRAVTSDPVKWAVLYPLIMKLFGDGVIGDAMKVGDENGAAALNARSDVAEAASKVGIPIGMFIQVLLMLLKLLRRKYGQD